MIPDNGKRFFLLRSMQTSSRNLPGSCLLGTAALSQGVQGHFKLTTPLPLALRFRISAAILLSPTSILSWHEQPTLPTPFIKSEPALQHSVRQQMKKCNFTCMAPQMEKSGLLNTFTIAALSNKN